MNCRTTAMFKMLIGLFMLAIVFVATPQQAQAFTLDVYNPYSENLDLALVIYNDERDAWKVTGWYAVSPNSTRTLDFNSSTMGNYVYIYAQTPNAAWTGAGYSGSIIRTVNSNRFEYYTPQHQCPNGPNLRQESFRKWPLENGYLYWTPAEG